MAEKFATAGYSPRIIRRTVGNAVTANEKIMAAMARLIQITETMRSSPECQAIREIAELVRGILTALRNETAPETSQALRPKKFSSVVGDELPVIARRRKAQPHAG